MTELPRVQHIIASGLIATVGVCIAYISYTQEPAQAFLFPRLISSVFAVLAIWTFGKAVLGKTKVGNGLNGTALKNMAPGLLVMIVYVFWAAKALGFYTATTITLIILISLYDPAPHTEAKSWIKRGVITAGVMVVLYLLFAQLLYVFTPREIFA